MVDVTEFIRKVTCPECPKKPLPEHDITDDGHCSTRQKAYRNPTILAIGILQGQPDKKPIPTKDALIKVREIMGSILTHYDERLIDGSDKIRRKNNTHWQHDTLVKDGLCLDYKEKECRWGEWGLTEKGWLEYRKILNPEIVKE